ncbi:unnamed protein product [Arctia plantaginis]|uniref:Uncharacterized protein n=1 Tax=Arctia plantaginis TaxID=874455 RepID=A0A8S0ZR97_ARCPL|nr:unnamed protein product [Arctia plantaginis]
MLSSSPFDYVHPSNGQDKSNDEDQVDTEPVRKECSFVIINKKNKETEITERVYISQVETMIMLVGSRTLEISTNAFTVNVPTVMNFAGRIISYTVLIIQYFYKKVFFQIK